MPGLLRPHQDQLQACMIPLYAGEEVQHWPWWHFFLHWPNHFDYNPIDPIYDEGMGLYNGMFDASIDLVHILILYQYDDISTVNCPPNTTSFDPVVHKCYITVGMFARRGLGSTKQWHWVSWFWVLSTKSEEDLVSFWWWVVNLWRNKSFSEEWLWVGSGKREEWGSEVFWLLPEYSSTMIEVKSGATSYPACLTYIPR